ncbi:hypothetical protein BRC68_07380 [Halobacteriales archaeon QH_6_64_20]|nr:MAG: hypothetical protein BRC68_07380 [Halobacteriales archaeon QH_6_64_20]
MSEVLGFILVFALVTTTMSFVYVSDLASLEERRDAERIDNAERAFDVLADNVEDIYRRDAPSRATEITISVVNGSNVTVSGSTLEADDGSGNTLETNDGRIRYSSGTYLTHRSPLVTAVYTASPRPIEYAADGSRIVYENGAVIRADAGSAIMKRTPSMHFAKTDTVVRLIETRPSARDGSRSVGGTTTALVRVERDKTAVLTPLVDQSPFLVNLTVRTTPARAATWERYLDARIGWTNPGTDSDPCDVSGDTVYCAFLVKERFEVVKAGIETTID